MAALRGTEDDEGPGAVLTIAFRGVRPEGARDLAQKLRSTEVDVRLLGGGPEVAKLGRVLHQVLFGQERRDAGVIFDVPCLAHGLAKVSRYQVPAISQALCGQR